MMEDRLEVEEQIQIQSRHFERQGQIVATGREDVFAAVEESALNPEVSALIERCLNGTEPFGSEDEKKSYHNQKLSSQNVQALLLKAAGFKNVEIAKMMTMDQCRLTVIFTHPYSKKILRAMRPHQVAKVIDIRTKMEQYAADLMDQTYLLASKSADLKEVSNVTFGLLDRAGYNPVNKSVGAVGKPGDFLNSATNAEVSRLASAMDESKLVDAVVMPGWRTPTPPDESSSLPAEEPELISGRGENSAGPVNQSSMQFSSDVSDVPEITQREMKVSRRSEPGE